MKDTFLDVKAQDEGGKDCIIEMQVLNVAGFERRVLYIEIANKCGLSSEELDAQEQRERLRTLVHGVVLTFGRAITESG